MLSATTAYYNKHAARWAATKTNSFWHEKQFRKFLKLVKRRGNVIDIGSAYGIHAPLFLGIGKGLRYEGMDISKSMVRLARERYPHLKFGLGDITKKTTLPKKKYNGFWSAATLMHIPRDHWNEMLSNIERLSKPGAIGYITLPTERPNPASKKDPRHFTLLKSGEFKKIARERKWKVLASGTMDGFHKNNIWKWFIVRLP